MVSDLGASRSVCSLMLLRANGGAEVCALLKFKVDFVWGASTSVCSLMILCVDVGRGGGLGSRPIFKKVNEPYAPS